MLKVYYKYSACIEIRGHNTSIVCDPWFSQNAYEGSWSQYPKKANFLDLFRKDFDFIYISHIHPDHYDPWSIRKLFEKFGEKKIIIAEWKKAPNYLEKKMIADGFRDQLLISDHLEFPDFKLDIIANDTGSKSAIDSALLITEQSSKKMLINLNDCILSEHLKREINNKVSNYNALITLLCLGYTGAGPYPQTYFSPVHEEKKLREKAEEKKLEFFRRYEETAKAFPSKYRLPFAGKYVLTGILSDLNRFRGVADALEIKKLDPDALVLSDSGEAYFDFKTEKASEEREDFYPESPPLVKTREFNYHKNFKQFEIESSLLIRLLKASLKNAHPKSECKIDCHWSIYPLKDKEEFLSCLSEKDPFKSRKSLITFNCNMNKKWSDTSENPKVHSCMLIEKRALFSALTGVSHWNNFEVGSIYQVRRKPDIYVPQMQAYLNFLSVI